MLRIRVNTLSRTTPVQPRVARWILRHGILILAFVLLGICPGVSQTPPPEHNPAPKDPKPEWKDAGKKWPGRGGWPEGDKKWPDRGGWKDGDKKWPGPDWLEATAKRLEQTKNISQPGQEIEFLVSRTSDLMDRAKQSRENDFRFGRLINAANALLNACDGILWARKTEKTPQESDFWGLAGMSLKGCYFRIRQADFFAPLSHEKNSEQYVTLARTLYQQARGAYDAREFTRAKSLADASGSIVFALESIAQANAPAPEPKSPK